MPTPDDTDHGMIPPFVAPGIDTQFVEHYDALRRIAHARVYADGGGFAVDTTSLVNECYLKLKSAAPAIAAHKSAFLAYASATMRSIIVDVVRQQLSQSRGGDVEFVPLNTAVADSAPALSEQLGSVLQIHEALQQLSAVDPGLTTLVELRYFGGLTFAEAADVLGVTERTVQRQWEKARLLLAAILSA